MFDWIPSFPSFPLFFPRVCHSIFLYSLLTNHMRRFLRFYEALVQSTSSVEALAEERSEPLALALGDGDGDGDGLGIHGSMNWRRRRRSRSYWRRSEKAPWHGLMQLCPPIWTPPAASWEMRDGSDWWSSLNLFHLLLVMGYTTMIPQQGPHIYQIWTRRWCSSNQAAVLNPVFPSWLFISLALTGLDDGGGDTMILHVSSLVLSKSSRYFRNFLEGRSISDSTEVVVFLRSQGININIDIDPFLNHEWKKWHSLRFEVSQTMYSCLLV